MVRRSTAGETGVPGKVMISTSCSGPLNTWRSAVSGSKGGPNPDIAVSLPTVSLLSAGQAPGAEGSDLRVRGRALGHRPGVDADTAREHVDQALQRGRLAF